ncbi:AbrB family transcriptional regulator [Roseomonas sp. CCTCC AB2023176]|uniref:AbrB family transcriptional regulator n=1 Tax=Roseomonas sp. CCTCC AB2023176 TaxID=3342640 RepID=UPI0035E1696B
MALPDRLRPHLPASLAAVAGGCLAALLHVPLPWMIGAMVATAALSWVREAPRPAGVREAALIALGLGLGQTFSGPVIAAVAGTLPVMVIAGLITILAGLAAARLFASLARVDARTAFFCTVPGGIILMVVLAQRAGGHVPTVTLSQTLRMCLVVLLFPPLISVIAPHALDAAFSAPRPPVDPLGLPLLLAAGTAVAIGAARLGVANPWMLGPCLLAIPLSGLGWLPSGVPAWMVNAAQVAMGGTLGLRLSRRFLLSSRRLAAVSVVTTLVLSAVLAALALPVAWLSGLPVAAVELGMAPGGMPEMTVTAKALDLAVPLVLGFHLVRVLLCNLLVGPIWRGAVRLGLVGEAGPSPEDQVGR